MAIAGAAQSHLGNTRPFEKSYTGVSSAPQDMPPSSLVLTFTTLLLLAQPASAQQPPCERSAPRALVQFGAGLVGSWSGGLTAFSVIDDVNAPNRRVKGDAGYQRDANVAYALGSWAGSAFGVALAGTRGCQSFWRAMIGAGIPSVVMMLGYDEPYLPLLGMVFGAPLQSLFATIAVALR